MPYKKKITFSVLLFVMAVAGVLGFLLIPKKIYEAHKAKEATFGDYAFIVFLVIVVVGSVIQLIANA
jgi:hypothetical protein